ncbi:NAD-dependent epimerase/dehydratase family protein [Roseateles amylovorans]|uniref:NAD(P)-dependent oxidoreductase n=1 Tax=Roseateles amylovorans TaxID=2978473 RepID=A0ABY6B0T3_9BURK|nr:NAD(P)-dependent oxidoreductase [Roseateles amylovorans]UXH77796.1 NAD(P)-dependent oxidoreductase [Roseateles amylovorans]
MTGGTGFLGRHVVWRLRDAGHHVIFTGRNAAAADTVLRHARPSAVSGASGARADFVRIEHGQAGAEHVLHDAACAVDAVVHCAARSSPWGPRHAFEQANVAATREVLAVCKSRAIGHLVHISTPGLYFDFSDRLNIREDQPLPMPANLYAATKGAAEVLVREADHLGSAVILRPRAIFGPHDNTLLPRLLRVARRGALPLMRGGRAWLDLTYVDNVVDAIELALTPSRPHPTAATFNISNGEPLQVSQLFQVVASSFDLPTRQRQVPYLFVDAMARAMECIARLRPGWEPPLTRYSAGLLAFSQTLDLTRARDHLGYAPRIPLREGMARTAQWFREQAGSVR